MVADEKVSIALELDAPLELEARETVLKFSMRFIS